MRNSVLIITEEDIRNFDALLEQTGEEVHFFASFDRTELACTIVRPNSESKGSVLFIHGIGARAHLYLPMADYLAENGYTIYMFDIRGHGFSHGVSGHMPSKDAMQKDILHFYNFVTTEESGNTPVIAAGHSLGTYIWIHTLSKYDEIKIDGLVLMSGGSVNKLNGSYTKLFTGQYSRYVSKWKAFISLFNSNIKPVHIGFPDLPQLEKAGFVEDYGFSFFTMFLNSNERFQEFYQSTEIPILMISGDLDELFSVNKIEETFSMITNSQKELTFLEGDTHTSIIWHAGPYIEGWMSKISGNE